MARIRTIKPTMAESDNMNALSYGARYFFLLFLCFLDDEGRAELLLKRIAGDMFPKDDGVEGFQIMAWIEECEAQGMLVRYQHGKRAFVYAPNFRAHQVIKKPTPSRLPAPPETDDSPTSSPPVDHQFPNGDPLEVEIGSGNRKKEIGKDKLVGSRKSADAQDPTETGPAPQEPPPPRRARTRSSAAHMGRAGEFLNGKAEPDDDLDKIKRDQIEALKRGAA